MSVLEAATREELLALRHGRRDVVWALTALAWRPEYFGVAARGLLRLAWAENEGYANNATGEWAGLFHIYLAGTAAPFADRQPTLEATLDDPDPDIRRLGMQALDAVLGFRLGMRIGGPPTGIAGVALADWCPSEAAAAEIVHWALGALGARLDDVDAGVRKAAVDALVNHTGALIRFGFLDPWAAVVRRLRDRPFAERAHALDVIRSFLDLEEGGADAEDLDGSGDADRTAITLRELVDGLKGNTLAERLASALAVPSWDVARKPNAEAALRALVDEALAAPESLRAQLPVLFSADPGTSSADLLGRFLGEADTADQWRDALVDGWTPNVGFPNVTTGYLDGSRERLGTEWLESLLDAWAASMLGAEGPPGHDGRTCSSCRSRGGPCRRRAQRGVSRASSQRGVSARESSAGWSPASGRVSWIPRSCSTC